MTLEPNTSVAVVVSKQWSDLSSIRRFLGPKDPGSGATDDSATLYAKLMDYSDPRGLWIELNTARRKHDKTVPLMNCLIPWAFVYSVVVITEHREDLRPNDRDDFEEFMHDLGGTE
jgi:hypothetical protein